MYTVAIVGINSVHGLDMNQCTLVFPAEIAISSYNRATFTNCGSEIFILYARDVYFTYTHFHQCRLILISIQFTLRLFLVLKKVRKRGRIS